MDDELERLINALLDGEIRCYDCHTKLDIQADGLERQSEQVYTTRYDCPGDGCSIEYDVQVKDEGLAVHFEANERGANRSGKLADITRISRKEPLQKKSHPVRKLTDASEELTNAFVILQHNHRRLQKAHKTIENGGLDQDTDFHLRVQADIHNYTASAYSFEKIVEKNVEPHIPSDGPIENAKNEFDEENEVIKALRTYAQHHLALPSSLVHFFDGDEGEVTITVPMDDLDDFRPGDPEASFDPVDGDYIDVADRVNRHYEAAEKLVATMLKVAEEKYEEQIEDYREAIRFPEITEE